MEEAHRARVCGSKSADFAQRMPLSFAVNTEAFIASLGLTALEFSSETFEICHAKDRLPLAAKVSRCEEIEARPFVRSRKRVTHAETRN
jgi:hypothetical protein